MNVSNEEQSVYIIMIVYSALHFWGVGKFVIDVAFVGTVCNTGSRIMRVPCNNQLMF